MDNVFLKTRELAEALMESEQYKKMKKAEDTAMKNTEAAEAMSEYLEKRRRVEELLSAGNVASEELKRLSDEMDDLQEKLQLIDDIKNLTDTRESFSELINQVNTLLQFIITGELDTGNGGCTGSCSTCSGCDNLH